jgi:hypothetical protein
MKPLDLKIEWCREHGLGAEQRGELLYIYGEKEPGRWHVLVFTGNPSYRRVRAALRVHLPAWRFI